MISQLLLLAILDATGMEQLQLCICKPACPAVIAKCYFVTECVSVWCLSMAKRRGFRLFLPFYLKLAGNFCCVSRLPACDAFSSCLVNVTQIKIKIVAYTLKTLSRLLRHKSSHYWLHPSYDMCAKFFAAEVS